MNEPASAINMINACFRHQHPEAYDREPVPEGIVPTELRYGRDEYHVPPTPVIPEESMGDPEAYHDLDYCPPVIPQGSFATVARRTELPPLIEWEV